MLGIDGANTWFAHAVTRTTNALQSAADSTWRFHLNHQINSAHVNAQLKTAGGDNGAQCATLQLIFNDNTLFTRE